VATSSSSQQKNDRSGQSRCDETERLRSERDALLAACKAALESTDGLLPGRVWIQLRAAVRLAEGGAHGS
jgi:hypothetical protein